MTAPLTRDPATAPYLAAVEAVLRGLPDESRAEVLADVEQHLAELAAEPDASLAHHLGTPTAFAEEFVASAGIEVPTVTRSPIDRLARVRELWWNAPSLRAARDFLPELRPAWWVARGYLVIAALAAFNGDDSPLPFPGIIGKNGPLSFVAVAGAVIGSIALGRHTSARPWNGIASTLGVVAAAVALSVSVNDAAYYNDYYDPGYLPAAEPGVVVGANGLPITNIWAYDTQGNLLEGVLLYDQAGNPLGPTATYDEPTGAELHTDTPVDANGAPIPNLYPLDQERVERDQFGNERRDPVPPPAVVVPRLSEPTSTTTTTAPTTATTPTTAPA